MDSALAAAPAATDAISLSLVLTVALATAALMAIAVFVRRSRRTGRLTGMTAAARGICAVGIVVSALLTSLALGGSSVPANDASPTPAVAIVPASTFDQPTTGDLGGPQLPTE